MISWLPLFAIVAGYGAARAYDFIASRWRPLALAALVTAMIVSMNPGPRTTAAKTMGDERRMQSIAQATGWIHRHAEPDAAVAISYYCFDSDVFFAWLHSIDAPTPAWADDGRRYLIWWGSDPRFPRSADMRAPPPPTSTTSSASWICANRPRAPIRFPTPASRASRASARSRGEGQGERCGRRHPEPHAAVQGPRPRPSPTLDIKYSIDSWTHPNFFDGYDYNLMCSSRCW